MGIASFAVCVGMTNVSGRAVQTLHYDKCCGGGEGKKKMQISCLFLFFFFFYNSVLFPIRCLVLKC